MFWIYSPFNHRTNNARGYLLSSEYKEIQIDGRKTKLVPNDVPDPTETPLELKIHNYIQTRDSFSTT